MSIRRFALAMMVALSTLAVGTATAAAPPGPRLAIQAFLPYPLLSGIETMGPNGEAPQRPVGGEGKDVIRPDGERPAWSPDGSRLAFTGSLGEYNPVIYVVGAGGGKPRLVSKDGPLSEPIFSADGRSVVFSTLWLVKDKSPQPTRRADGDSRAFVTWAILEVDIDSRRARPLIPPRRGQILNPTSFSPDGSKLAAERYTRKGGAEAVAIDLGSGRATLLAHNAVEPIYSPDGSRIALLRTPYDEPPNLGEHRVPVAYDLVVMPASGGKPIRLVRAKEGIAWPSWDPSGRRLSFTRLDPLHVGPTQSNEGEAVMQINADGTCLTQLLAAERGSSASVSGSAWQPGVGREAGPISC